MSSRETKLTVVDVKPTSDEEGMSVILMKDIIDGRQGEIGESAFVNMYTIDNITFSKGLVIKKETIKMEKS